MKKPVRNSRARFILCDDVRADASGKISFVGVYAGEKILVFATRHEALLKDLSVTLVAKLDRVVVPRWGKFAARFVVGKEALEFPFEITAAPAITKPPEGAKP